MKTTSFLEDINMAFSVVLKSVLIVLITVFTLTPESYLQFRIQSQNVNITDMYVTPQQPQNPAVAPKKYKKHDAFSSTY